MREFSEASASTMGNGSMATCYSTMMGLFVLEFTVKITQMTASIQVNIAVSRWSMKIPSASTLD